MRSVYVMSGSYLSTFEELDIQVLRSMGDVRVVHWKNMLGLWREIRACDFVFRWFADLPAWISCRIARRHHKPTVIVAGGYDTEGAPDLGYGLSEEYLLNRWITVPMRNWVLKHCDMMLCISRFTQANCIALGAKNTQMLHLGVDVDRFHYDPSLPRHPRVITVGYLSEQNIRKKGYDTFVRAAALVSREIPEAEFVILGEDQGGRKPLLGLIARHGAPVAVRAPGDQEAYRKCLAESCIYVQGSVLEAFGLALAEGMACGCWPVVTEPGGALPEVAGNLGARFSFDDHEQLAAILTRRLRIPFQPSEHAACRQRVVQCFPLSKRGEGIRDLAARLTSLYLGRTA